jgi:glycine/D-amino acid oxidase-like deaminating enzyme
MAKHLFHNDFQAKPYWWEAYQPTPLPQTDLPTAADAIIIGAGYAGLATALELARNGRHCLVLDAHEPGFGGSSRSGGQVSGGVNVGKRMIRKPLSRAEATPLLNEAADAFTHIEKLIIDNNIDCGWHKNGYFLGAWCQSHFNAMKKKIEVFNDEAQSDAFLVTRDQQRSEIGSDYYFGGMVVSRAAHLHPALYFKGLLDLAQKAGIAIASNTPVTKLIERNGVWEATTSRGTIRAKDVVIATNGYTGDLTPRLKRRIVPVGSYIIATEELPDDIIRTLIPNNRAVADSRRVLTYYRLSPDRKRLIFGGRARFSLSDPIETAPLVYQLMLDRFPQLKGTKITHAWTGNVAFTFDELPHTGKQDGLHYALGCNGSGIAMMTWLGHQSARRVLGHANSPSAFDQSDFPTLPFYSGNPWFLPLVGASFRMMDWWDRKFR